MYWDWWEKMNCPDCNKKVLNKYLKHCAYCGLIFDTYKPIKKVNTFSRLKNKHCFGCKSENNLSRHHILPQRIKKNKKTVILCKSCHKIADLLATKYYEGVEILIK